MIHSSLGDYYSYIDVMTEDNKYSKTEIDNMYPFERDVLISIGNQRVGTQATPPIEAPVDF